MERKDEKIQKVNLRNNLETVKVLRFFKLQAQVGGLKKK